MIHNMSYLGTLRISWGRILLSIIALSSIMALGGLFVSSEVIMVMKSNGYNIPDWVANATTTIGSVYGIQSLYLSALGVSIAAPLAAILAGLNVASL